MSNNVDEILIERGKTYGNFNENAAISQALKLVMQGGVMVVSSSCKINVPQTNWLKLSPPQREALEMDMHKTARILNGDPNYLDSWVDKIGYIQLVVNMLKVLSAMPKKEANYD